MFNGVIRSAENYLAERRELIQKCVINAKADAKSEFEYDASSLIKSVQSEIYLKTENVSTKEEFNEIEQQVVDRNRELADIYLKEYQERCQKIDNYYRKWRTNNQLRQDLNPEWNYVFPFTR